MMALLLAFSSRRAKTLEKFPAWFVVYRRVSKKKEAIYYEQVFSEKDLKKAISAANRDFPEKEYMIELTKKEPFMGW